MSEISNEQTTSEGPWVRPPGFPRRLDVRVTPGSEPRDGFRIYAPQRRIALLRYKLGRLPVVRSYKRPQNPPPWPYEQLAEMAGIHADSAVAMRSSTNGRWIVGLECDDTLVAVAKCDRRKLGCGSGGEWCKILVRARRLSRRSF